MIDDKLTIEEAKKNYSQDILQHNAFLHGVEWAEERCRALWQSAIYRPTRNQVIITQDTDGDYNVVSTSAVIPPTLKAREEWERFVYINRIVTWAYTGDIVKLLQK